jgi:hypothetical protein
MRLQINLKRQMKPSKPLRSDIAWSNAEAIGVRGYDLCNDLLGKVNFGDMAFLEMWQRTEHEATDQIRGKFTSHN